PAAFADDLVERLLARVPERRMAEVVAEADRLDEVLVQPERARDGAGDPGRLERVRQAGAEVVALGVDEDLRLVAQPPERLGVDDPVAVALERRPEPAFRFGQVASARLVRPDGERRQPPLLVLPHEPCEGIGNPTGELRHPDQPRGTPRRLPSGSGPRPTRRARHTTDPKRVSLRPPPRERGK